MLEGNTLEKLAYDELVKKVEKQEERIMQLVKIVAATNHRLSELQSRQEKFEEMLPSKKILS